VQNYADLANPKLKGKFCSRSGSHPYNLSLMASVIAHEGEAKAEEWARGMVANFARAPKGGDTDQIKAVAAGECGVAMSNTYYVARLLRSTKPEDQKLMEKIGVVWPNQASTGTHINVSGGGMLKTRRTRKQRSSSWNTWPPTRPSVTLPMATTNGRSSTSVKVANPALDASRQVQGRHLPVKNLAMYQAKAQMIFDRAGFK
jgi:iron(III) transport system substrate-binding protein